jgi:glycosyltransferase involved in cell wall biosynthesis
MIRVAHCVGSYFPDQVGGIEVYVQDLLAELGKSGVGGHVIAATNETFRQYEWEGVQVARYPSNWANVREYSVARPHAGLSKFQELVLGNRPDIFHLHSWTGGAGLEHLAQIARLDMPCVVTMHVPSALCMRGTMLLHGRRACDGLIEERRCAQCWSEGRGVPSAVAFALSHLPGIPPDIGVSSKLMSRAVTLLSARARAVVQAYELHQMAELSEKIVVPSLWAHDGLLVNGIAPEKVLVSRQGVGGALLSAAARSAPRLPSEELRVGFIGRLEPYKGTHILIEAMNRLPSDLPVRLLIAGSGSERRYVRRLIQTWAGDARVEFLGPITREQVPDFLRKIDVLAVPSGYMETGPLVVLEAHAFGIPVMGANLGGISERILDGFDGWLLPFDDSGAWAAAIRHIALDRSELERCAANIGRIRTMADVAADMAKLYSDVLAARGAAA